MCVLSVGKSSEKCNIQYPKLDKPEIQKKQKNKSHKIPK